MLKTGDWQLFHCQLMTLLSCFFICLFFLNVEYLVSELHMKTENTKKQDEDFQQQLLFNFNFGLFFKLSTDWTMLKHSLNKARLNLWCGWQEPPAIQTGGANFWWLHDSYFWYSYVILAWLRKRGKISMSIWVTCLHRCHLELKLTNTCDYCRVIWPRHECWLYPFPLQKKTRCQWVLMGFLPRAKSI